MLNETTYYKSFSWTPTVAQSGYQVICAMAFDRQLAQPHRQKLHRQAQRQLAQPHRQAQRQPAQPHRQAQRQRAQPQQRPQLLQLLRRRPPPLQLRLRQPQQQHKYVCSDCCLDLTHDMILLAVPIDWLLIGTLIGNYVSNALLKYSYYQVDFRSIFKTNFDLICYKIKPDQVISLTLSDDDDDTPGQSELFLSRFRIEQFIRLQSLTLFNIELNALESILLSLNKLTQLRLFSFHTKDVRREYLDWVSDYSSKITRINQLILETFIQVSPRLNRLSLSNGTTLTTIPFQRLRCLILGKSTIDQLQMVFTHTPELRSLNVCLIGNISNIECLHPPSQLNPLTLTINGEYFRILLE
ncbi:unnamed protein product [Rotaria sordida]|uniref:Uncharacterized protein n=1 Tax=Rotaria sordida TaxID=392033 RepID=A0A814RK73_9BILA|nr:unnamed protein product [Rotaria sordida]